MLQYPLQTCNSNKVSANSLFRLQIEKPILRAKTAMSLNKVSQFSPGLQWLVRVRQTSPTIFLLPCGLANSILKKIYYFLLNFIGECLIIWRGLSSRISH